MSYEFQAQINDLERELESYKGKYHIGLSEYWDIEGLITGDCDAEEEYKLYISFMKQQDDLGIMEKYDRFCRSDFKNYVTCQEIRAKIQYLKEFEF